MRRTASFDVSTYPAEARAILQAMKTYGMFPADNGRGRYVSGVPDPRRSDRNLGTLERVTSSAFGMVTLGAVHR